jgi:5-amino-6-(5-phosphoribosylamino)uracil reductase
MAPERPYTLLSCAVSIDGYLGGPTGGPLALSNAADLDRVDAQRAAVDAILVGAGTIRQDDPRLLVRSPERTTTRVSAGRAPSPVKVTLTGSGKLDPGSRFFRCGDGPKLVYCGAAGAESASAVLGEVATVVVVDPLGPRLVSEDLHRRGVRSLMVEGGGSVLTQLLAADLADELQLVVAPVLVGDSRATRLVGDGSFPWTVQHRARLAEVRQVGDVALLRYALSPRFGTGPDVAP